MYPTKSDRTGTANYQVHDSQETRLNTASSHSNLKYLFILIFLVINAAFLIHNHDVRLAMTSSDESPVTYAYYVKYPDRFEVDARMNNWMPVPLASMHGWLPALLFKYFDIPPDLPTLFWAFLQNILLGFGVFRFAWVVTKRWDIAWLSLFFTTAIRPHWYNLALYADLDYRSNAGHLGFSFLVFGASFILEKKFFPAFIFLALGGLTHPSLTFYMLAITGTYWLWQFIQERQLKDFFWKLAIVVVVASCAFLPQFILTSGIEQRPNDQVLESMMHNGHVVPWDNPGCSYCLPGFIRSLLFIPLFVSIAFLYVNDLDKNAALFWKACLLATGLMSLAHPVIILLQLPMFTLLSLNLMRSTMFLLIFTVPMFIGYLIKRFYTGNWIIRAVVAYCLIYPVIFKLLATLLILLSTKDAELFGRKIKPSYSRLFGITGYSLLVLIILYYIPYTRGLVTTSIFGEVIGNFAVKSLFGPFFGGGNFGLILTLFILTFILFLVSRYIFRIKPLPILTLVIIWFLMVYSLKNNYSIGFHHTNVDSEWHALYEAQLWSRNNTPTDASFITTGSSLYASWRTISRRPVIGGIDNAYFYPKTAVAYNNLLSEFYTDYFNLQLESIDEPTYGFPGLDESGLLAFSERFGGDYIVRNVTQPQLTFPIVYQNTHYIIYELAGDYP